MSEIVEILMSPGIQAISWLACIMFAIYFALYVKKLSFGDDTGSKAWELIAVGLFLIGLRVIFKTFFPELSDSYGLQVARFSLGIIGIIILYIGFSDYQSVLRRMFGESY
ncbi:MAG: hypothetical protein SCH39_02965 [Methanosarcinales archaeon]|nr:hypothetical protein [ANME-2 cluster archaeon]MDW7775282.1 hypothetical protein [Methanosarcinales archaeon]